MDFSKLDLEQVFSNLESIASNIDFYKNNRVYFNSNYRRYSGISDSIEKLQKYGYDEDLETLKELSQCTNYNEFVSLCEPVLERVNWALESLKPYRYQSYLVNGSYYKFKSLYYSDNEQGRSTLRLATVSCHTKEELNSLVASIQKGQRFSADRKDIVTLKAG
jgi:hypothetical protein